MDLETFHRKLLGLDQAKTPKNFKLSEVHKALYSSVADNKRGYRLKLNGAKTDPERFLATLVLAFHMTVFPTPGRVTFIVSRITERWAIEQIKGTAYYIYRSRKGASKESIEAIDEALRSIEIGSRALQLEGEPERWVSYGFNNQDILPPWMRGRLFLK